MPDVAVTAAVLGRVIVQAGRALDAPFGEILDRYAMTRNAWWLLTELYRSRKEDVATIGEHARRSGLAASSATIAIEQLTARKLTRRRRPKDNRRITFVTITDTGVTFVEEVRADLETAVAGIYGLYDDNDRQLLHDLLVRIVENAEMNVSSSEMLAAARSSD
jgi:DNA-binding MarR family transcriptional regulator